METGTHIFGLLSSAPTWRCIKTHMSYLERICEEDSQVESQFKKKMKGSKVGFK